MAEETRESTLTIRLTPSTKARAMRRALQEGRGLENYIAWLVERDYQAVNQRQKSR